MTRRLPMRRGTLWQSVALAALMMLGSALSVGTAWGEEAARPNVLLIVSDDLNNDLGCYGHPLVKSPHIDRLAAQGTRFDRAYCQYSVCNPSRSSFMTGVYPDQTGVLSNAGNFRKRLPDFPTMPQHFSNQGYFVARVGKIYHYGVPNQIGTNGADDDASWQVRINPRGIDREVHDQIHTLQPGQFGGTLSWLALPNDAGEHTDEIGASEAIKLLKQHHPNKTGKPFFLAMGFYRPHTPYVAPQKYFDLYDRAAIQPVMEQPGERDDIPRAALPDRPHQRELTVEKRREIIQAYYASISLMDAQVGRLLDALKQLELDDNTIVIFTSDHGYHLGRHGLWQKSDLFEDACRVPLIVYDPRRTSHPPRTAALAELVDLYRTLADLCGLSEPTHPLGTSLRAVLDDPTSELRDAAFTTTLSRTVRGCQGYSIRTGRYRYTEWNSGEHGVELYDYDEDPEERVNRATSEDHAAIRAELKQRLERAIAHGTQPVGR